MQSTTSSLRFRKNANSKIRPLPPAPRFSQTLPFHHDNPDQPERSKIVEGITSDTVPSPNWSKDQCIEWIRCVFFEKAGLSEQSATIKANYWKNSGAILFERSQAEFTHIWHEQARRSSSELRMLRGWMLVLWATK